MIRLAYRYLSRARHADNRHIIVEQLRHAVPTLSNSQTSSLHQGQAVPVFPFIGFCGCHKDHKKAANLTHKKQLGYC